MLCEKYLRSSVEEQQRVATEMNLTVNELKKEVLDTDLWRVCSNKEHLSNEKTAARSMRNDADRGNFNGDDLLFFGRLGNDTGLL